MAGAARISPTFLMIGGGLVLCGFACEERRPSDPLGAAPTGINLAPLPEASMARVTDAGPPKGQVRPGSRRSSNEPVGAATSEPQEAADPAGSVVSGFIVDALVDVAGAGPATATSSGVAMVNRRNQLQLAKLSRSTHAEKPGPTPISSLAASAGPFPLARGPAVRNGWAYWVSRGRLLRQSLRAAGSEKLPTVLAEDARVGTRVSVPTGLRAHERKLPDIAAYIARPSEKKGALVAKLWRRGHSSSLLLTEEAASATSVSLLATAKGLAVLSLEGRTGMSTVHLRPLLSREGATSGSRSLQLGEDRVVWVGGGSGPLSEFWPFRVSGDRLEGLMAAERDMTHFGLVALSIPLAGPQEPVRASWMDYLNGIQPAPVAGIEVCGRLMLLLAQPSERRAHAPQRLLWIEQSAESPAEGMVLAHGRSFFDLSVAKLTAGALIVYVSDHRTWARTIRCAN